MLAHAGASFWEMAHYIKEYGPLESNGREKLGDVKYRLDGVDGVMRAATLRECVRGVLTLAALVAF